MEELHKGTADTWAVLVLLGSQDRWVTHTEVAQTLAIHRDTARRILETLTHFGAAQARAEDGTWCSGAALHQLGLAHLNRMHQRARAIQAELEALLPATLPNGDHHGR